MTLHQLYGRCTTGLLANSEHIIHLKSVIAFWFVNDSISGLYQGFASASGGSGVVGMVITGIYRELDGFGI